MAGGWATVLSFGFLATRTWSIAFISLKSVSILVTRLPNVSRVISEKAVEESVAVSVERLREREGDCVILVLIVPKVEIDPERRGLGD